MKSSPPAPAAETDGWDGDDSPAAPPAAGGGEGPFPAGALDAAPKIVRDGCDMRVSGGLFGFGSYFAENACKADQSARADASLNRADEFPLLLCRVALGACVPTAARLETARRPPCIEGHYDGGFIRCDHPRADSLYAQCTRRDHVGAVARHREYVIFDLHQAYPQFLITYRRSK